MSAETLRKAVSLVRERAEAAAAAIGDEWQMRDQATLYSLDYRDADGEWRNAFECGPCAAWNEAPGPKHEYVGGHEEVAEHIASWHPAVALAVADWLDVVLDDFDVDAERTNNDYEGSFDLTEYEAGWFSHHPALAVARAYLGESA